MGRATRVTEWVFPPVPPTYDGSHGGLVYFPVEGAGTEAPAMLLGRESFAEEDLPILGSLVATCVIYFHSNGCDIGLCLDDMLTFRDGALDGDAVILCPEYPGYGLLREYEPSVSGINLMARAAFRYCIEGLGFSPSQVMLWGRSIGTGPATELAYTLALEAKSARESADFAGADATAPARAGEGPPAPAASAQGARAAVVRCGSAGADDGAGPVALPAAPAAPASAPAAASPWPARNCGRGGGGDGGCGAPAGGVSEEQTEELLREGIHVPESWPRRAGAYFGSARAVGEALRPPVVVGAEVLVKEPFLSDSEGRTELKRGERGTVVRVDDRGDALIDFQAHTKCQWVFHANLVHMAIRVVEPPVGALILLAPLISVSAVVQHHVPSRLAASLVGPMWEVLERAKDPVMEGVPLLIIHPKCDEIVPSSHGQAVFEKASSRQKFGVWLCNATHNISLDEDHLRIARSFLREVINRRITSWKPGQRTRSAVVDGPWSAEEDEEGALEVAARLMEMGLTGRAEEVVMMSL